MDHSTTGKEVPTIIGVGEGSGQNFVQGDYDSIKLLQEKLLLLEKFRRDSEEFENLKEKSKWHSMDELPNEGEFVFTMKDGKICNFSTYYENGGWYMYTGEKLARLFVKGFYKWKYSKDII